MSGWVAALGLAGAALAAPGLQGAQSLHELFDGLRSPDAAVRTRSQRALAGLDEIDDPGAVRAALGDASVVVRIEAVRLLGRAAPAWAADPLAASLANDVPAVAELAAESLERIGAPAIPSLLALARSRDRDTSRRALQALRGIDDPRAAGVLLQQAPELPSALQAAVVEALAGMVGRPGAAEELLGAAEGSPQLRRIAAQALRSARSDAAREAVIGASRNGTAAVRSLAVEAMGEWGAVVQPRLLDALGDSDSDVRRSAALALVRAGDDRAIGPLVAALRDRAAPVRAAAARALAAHGDGRAVEPLIECLGDADVEARTEAATALGRIGDRRAEAALTAATQDRSATVRAEAVEALLALGRPPLEYLLARVTASRPALRAEAVRALAGRRDRRAADAIVDRLLDEDAEVRREAERVLRGMDETSRSALERAAALERLELRRLAQAILDGKPLPAPRDSKPPRVAGVTAPGGAPPAEPRRAPDLDERAQAVLDFERRRATLVELVAAQGTGAVPRLLQTLEHPHSDLRAAAAELLARVPDPRSVAPLLAALADRDPRVRRWAAASLAVVGDANIVGPLSRLARDQNVEVREAAAPALGRVGGDAAVATLAELAADGESDVRRAAVAALADTDGVLAVEPLLGVLAATAGGRDWELERLAIVGLSRKRDAAARERILGALYVGESSLQRPLVSVLAQMEGAWAEQKLVELATSSPHRGVRIDVLGALVDRAPHATWMADTLIAASDDSDSQVRAYAVSLLGRSRDGRRVAVLTEALGDPASQVRTEAARPSIPPDDPAYLAAVVALLGNQGESSLARSGAIRTLGRIGAPAAIEALLGTLSDPSARHRGEAAGALVGLDLPESAAARLMASLKDADPRVRCAAIDALGRMRREAALPELLRLVSEGDPEERQAATEAVARFDPGALRAPAGLDAGAAFESAEAIAGVGPDAPSWMVERLAITATAGASALLRGAAVDALARRERGDLVALEVLMGVATKDEDPDVRGHAVRGFRTRSGARAARAMSAVMVGDSAAEVREGALVATTPWRREDAALLVPALVAVTLGDESAAIRKHAAERLLVVASAAQRTPPLVAALADPDAEVRRAAAQGISGAEGAGARSALAEKAADSSEEPGVRGKALERLATVEGGAEILLAALDDPDARVRSHALRNLVNLRPEGLGARVLPALDDESAEVQVAAIRFLGRLQYAPATPRLVELLSDPSAWTRAAAAEALSSLVAPEAVPQLIGLLHEPNTNVQYFAITALVRQRDLRAVVPIAALLDSPDQRVARTAAEALASSGDQRGIEPLRKRLARPAHKNLREVFQRALATLERGRRR